jgi:hypothetical protein
MMESHIEDEELHDSLAPEGRETIEEIRERIGRSELIISLESKSSALREISDHDMLRFEDIHELVDCFFSDLASWYIDDTLE